LLADIRSSAKGSCVLSAVSARFVGDSRNALTQFIAASRLLLPDAFGP
jgi:hypothetical protein